MKLKTCFLTVRLFEVKILNSLIREAKIVLQKRGAQQKVLTDPSQALITTEPYTEREFQEEPSYVVDDCLVTVRFWWNIFDGPAVSIIVVGPSKNVTKIKNLFVPICRRHYNNGRCDDRLEKFRVSDNEFDCPDDFDWLNNYFYAEVLARDLREGTIQLKVYSGSTLWDEVKELVIIGERLSGEPEILHEIEDRLRQEGSTANRAQIRKVLESVPHIFPEDWKSPEDYNSLTPQQKAIYLQLTGLGFRLTGLEIQRVIELALQYKSDRKSDVKQ